MEAVRGILKQSPFDSDMLELHASIELAEAYRVAGQNQRASATFERAAALLAPPGRNDTQTAVVIFNDWALALDKLGQPLEAERLFRRAIDISRAGQTEETVSPILLNNYAKTLYQLGRFEKAADYAGRAYAKAQRTDDQMVLYQSSYGRALIYIEQHDFNHAATMLAEVEPRLGKASRPTIIRSGHWPLRKHWWRPGGAISKPLYRLQIRQWPSWKPRAKPVGRAATSCPSRSSAALR